MSKIDLLKALSLKRKADRLHGHTNIGDYHNGEYDCGDFVSPWTLSACNVDADVMIIAQDWTSHYRIGGPFDPTQARCGYISDLRTNKNIKRLLNFFGFELKDTYATNAFVFVKPGKMNAVIPQKDFSYSVKTYAIPQIEIVKPRMAICLGGQTFNTIRQVLGHNSVPMTLVQASPLTMSGTEIVGVNHPGAWGMKMAGGYAKVEAQWKFLAERLNDMLLQPNPRTIAARPVGSRPSQITSVTDL